MPRPFLFLVLACLLAFLLNPAQPRLPSPTVDFSSPAVANEVLVRLSGGGVTLPDSVLARRLGGDVIDRLPEIGVVRLRLPGSETPEQAAARLAGQPLVESVEPNLLVHAAITPNDPLYTAQTGYLAIIGAPAAWDIELGADSVLVAVLDSGIDLSHPDLDSKVWTNPNEIPGNGVDDDMDGCVDDMHGCSFVSPTSSDPSCGTPASTKIDDDNGHGTFVAGIIAARGNNAMGISGAAPGVTILPVKILDCLGGGTASDAARAILYAARMGARVTNISFGADGESQTLANAMLDAYTRYGMIIVAATGNEGTNRVSFPARLPEAFAVGSSGTPSDPTARSPFSDWGPEVSFVAPGLNIISTVPAQFCGKQWFCVEGQPYAVASGTSFAAPLVSALAALIISHNPFIGPEAVRKIIASTSDSLPDAGTPGWYGAGRINMQKALRVKRYALGVSGVAKN